MIQEILKNNGLNDEQITNILNAMKESKIYLTKNENIDERYNKLKIQKSELETQLKERDTQLTDLSKKNNDNEGLLSQIKELQDLNKQTTTNYENKINQIQFDYALESELNKAGCKNIKAVKALLNMDKIKYQEGKPEGLQEQIEVLQKNDSYLFNLETTPVNTGNLGNFARGNNQTPTGSSQSSFMDVIKNNSLRK